MAFALFKSTLARTCLAVGIIQVAVLAHVVTAHAQERGAPITYAGAIPAPQATAGPGAGTEPGASPGVTWRYPDEPDVVYSANGVSSAAAVTPAAPANQPAVLDLRRASAPVADSMPPESANDRPEWLADERVGPPYQEAGAWYVPTPEPGFSEEGALAIYGAAGNGAPTASGEAYDPRALTAAHPTLPIPSLVQVTDLTTGRDVIVRLNDRGPFNSQGLVAMTPAAVQALGASQGARVHVRYLGPAPRRVMETTQATTEPAYPPAVAPGIPPAPAPNLRPDTALSALPVPPNVAPQNVAQTRPASYAPAPTAAPSGAFTVQLGAFANLENAHALRARVRTAGVVVIEPVATAQGELFRVRLGPFPTEREAQSALAQAERLGVRGGAVRALR